MSENQSRAEFLRSNPKARAWAALDQATNDQKQVTPGAVKLKPNQFAGKRALILGAGVSGLTTAYELLAQKTGMKVTILEAQNRTGGRCLSLRTGDTLTEDVNAELFDSEPGETQVVRFKCPLGDSEPYLNAGPGRIPSSHKRLLSYLRQFGVEVEVYVMNSESNLVQMKDGPLGNDDPVVYRRLDHNTRGWLAQMVYENADDLVREEEHAISDCDCAVRAEQLRQLMVSFGELTANGKYVPTAGEDGLENGLSRAGYEVLPGVEAGKTMPPLPLDDILKSEFWKKTRFYQPSDFLWQPTLFQPVGGMDQVQRSFAKQVAALGGTIHLNSPVQSIGWDDQREEFVVKVRQIGTEECLEYRADYCFSNMAIPFLSKILDRDLQCPDSPSGLDLEFKESLQAVYKSQFEPSGTPDENGYVARFLAATSKVGWQAERSLWQGKNLVENSHPRLDVQTVDVPDSEVGVVPIFGGISWTDDEIAQIWYPSTGYHDQKGVLTGAYNFSNVAFKWGMLPVEERLEIAREGAAKFGAEFGAGLRDGVAIAWQNMPFIKGGWANWHVLGDEAVGHFNTLTQGSSISDASGKKSAPVFFIVGDQLSSLPGWQEGAIASGLNALGRAGFPELAVRHLSNLPDTRLMVEGI